MPASGLPVAEAEKGVLLSVPAAYTTDANSTTLMRGLDLGFVLSAGNQLPIGWVLEEGPQVW